MKNKNSLWVWFFYLLSLSTATAQQVHYVKPASAGNADGSSWENASQDLKGILDKAVSGDTLWVASGMYTGGFTLKEGVSVFGGFSGTENSLGERKLPGSGENLTVLDGQNRQTVLTQPQGFDTETVWDGFVIQNGKAVNGGGAYLFRNGILRRCIIRNNTAGMPTIGSYNTKAGGVILRVDEETLKATIIAGENCGRTFQTGITGLTPKASVESALEDKNGMGNCQQLTAGRALQIVKKYRAPYPADTFDDWYIPSIGEWSEFATGKGSGGNKTSTYETVETALIKNSKTPLGSNSFWSSTAQSNGSFPSAWYVDFSSNDINYVNIWQYHKIRPFRVSSISPDEGQGGGIYSVSGKLEGCLILQNKAPEGSGTYARGNTEIINCTFVGNKQCALANPSTLNAQVVDAGSSVKIYNTLLSANTDANECASNWHGSMQAAYSAVETNLAVSGNNNIILTDNNGIQPVHFADAMTGNYRLTENSPCVDAGNTTLVPALLTTDLDGKPRISGNKVSIGAFESYQSTGLNESLAPLDVLLYPNPVRAGGSVQIDLSQLSTASAGQVKIAVKNILGSTLLSVSPDSRIYQLTMPEVPGIYFIRIQSDGKHREFKIIVTN